MYTVLVKPEEKLYICIYIIVYSPHAVPTTDLQWLDSIHSILNWSVCEAIFLFPTDRGLHKPKEDSRCAA